MNTEIIILLCIVAAVAIAYFALQKRREAGRSDIDIPAATQRGGLIFCAYGWWRWSQLEQTKGWVNLHWEMFRAGVDEAVRAIQFMECDALLDLDPLVLTPRKEDEDGNVLPRYIQEGAEANMHSMFVKMRAGGVLGQIKRLAACDEFNLRPDGVAELLPELVPMIRRVAATYPEMTGMRMFAMLTTLHEPKAEHLALFDDFGINDYSAKSSILGRDGAVTRLIKRLRPGQRVFTVPGASHGQDITPFLNHANATPQVAGICYYLHELNPKEGQERSLPSQHELLAQYRAAGEAIVGAK